MIYHAELALQVDSFNMNDGQVSSRQFLFHQTLRYDRHADAVYGRSLKNIGTIAFPGELPLDFMRRHHVFKQFPGAAALLANDELQIRQLG